MGITCHIIGETARSFSWRYWIEVIINFYLIIKECMLKYSYRKGPSLRKCSTKVNMNHVYRCITSFIHNQLLPWIIHYELKISVKLLRKIFSYALPSLQSKLFHHSVMAIWVLVVWIISGTILGSYPVLVLLAVQFGDNLQPWDNLQDSTATFTFNMVTIFQHGDRVKSTCTSPFWRHSLI